MGRVIYISKALLVMIRTFFFNFEKKNFLTGVFHDRCFKKNLFENFDFCSNSSEWSKRAGIFCFILAFYKSLLLLKFSFTQVKLLSEIFNVILRMKKLKNIRQNILKIFLIFFVDHFLSFFIHFQKNLTSNLRILLLVSNLCRLIFRSDPFYHTTQKTIQIWKKNCMTMIGTFCHLCTITGYPCLSCFKLI